MEKMAKTLRNHRPLLMSWFKANGQLSSGVVEGFNNKPKFTMRKSHGFRTLWPKQQLQRLPIATSYIIGFLQSPADRGSN
ncbi:hypothetical protein IMCC3135_24615 [Granulosicoccus antarcticus IMCC3135]|uniref:Transposase IS204/IS1001/IS1096/IS1165 DDE domain-containing protein n=1 Tax=Granulosicoccus antarcticus IMCC3135 TaxID=1192854 RepID=A0A2Z2NUK1_9GAMM|nr:hypothetical protein IMCC3135_24615 [Granulosicoccus antarcticus IMCC3135]